jgi:hypothetical protein
MWEIMSEEEFAAVEEDSGNTVILRNGVWWRKVRPFFFRPLLPFKPCRPEALKGAFGPFTGTQHAVDPGQPFNSHFNILIWDRLQEYSLAAVSQHTRSKVRKAMENGVALNRVTDAGPFVREAFPVYQSFVSRTRYAFLSERRERADFEAWAGKLLSHPKLMILAAVHGERLVSFYISCRVGDWVVLKAAINSEASLGLHAPDLAIHNYREQASRIPEIRFLADSFFQEHDGVNTFKIRRGARVAAFPAMLRIPGAAGAFLKTFRKPDYRQLLGFGPEALQSILDHDSAKSR